MTEVLVPQSPDVNETDPNLTFSEKKQSPPKDRKNPWTKPEKDSIDSDSGTPSKAIEMRSPKNPSSDVTGSWPSLEQAIMQSPGGKEVPVKKGDSPQAKSGDEEQELTDEDGKNGKGKGTKKKGNKKPNWVPLQIEIAGSHRSERDRRDHGSDRGRGGYRGGGGSSRGKWRTPGGPRMYQTSSGGNPRREAEERDRHGPPHSAPPNGQYSGSQPPRMWRGGRGRNGSYSEQWGKFPSGDRVPRGTGGGGGYPYPPGVYDGGMFGNQPPMYYPSYAPGTVFFQPQTLPDNIRVQIEYYFSDENLVKDIFLRNQMDDQGFVHVSVIARFNRVRHLSIDQEFILECIAPSRFLEISGQKIRRAFGWEQWLMTSSPQSDGGIPEGNMFGNFPDDPSEEVLLDGSGQQNKATGQFEDGFGYSPTDGEVSGRLEDDWVTVKGRKTGKDDPKQGHVVNLWPSESKQQQSPQHGGEGENAGSNFTPFHDESDEEFDDDKIDRIVLVTQMPRKHQGGDRTPSQITKHRITSDLAHVINDGLYFYEKVLRVC
jgi:la-related protein 1